MRASKLHLLLLSFMLFNFSCKKEKTIREKALDTIFEQASSQKNLRCLLVYKDNQIVKEMYFIGDSSTLHDVRSVTKSIMSTLVGIAVDKQIIKSEKNKIGDYLDIYAHTLDTNKEAIKISEILSMTSGISGNELVNAYEYINWLNAPHQIAFTLNKVSDQKPGKRFTYNSGVSHLLSGVLTNASHESCYQFAQKNLFQALGITDFKWQTDNQGYYNGGAGLQLAPKDMLKFGQLYLNKGVYNGIRVVSEDWITKATSFKISTNGIDKYGKYYGYLWWIGNVGKHNYYFAGGYGGQLIVVVPDLDLIVIATNNWQGVSTKTANQQWYATLDIIVNKIITLYQ